MKSGRTYRKSTVFRFIIYPGSETGFDFYRIAVNLRYAGFFYCYALHDKDVFEDTILATEDYEGHTIGDPKKPHYHFVVWSDYPVSTNRIQDMTGTNTFIMTGYPRGQNQNSFVRYLIHLDDPDKAQYDRSIIYTNYSQDVLCSLLEKSDTVYEDPQEAEKAAVLAWVRDEISSFELGRRFPKVINHWASLERWYSRVHEENQYHYNRYPKLPDKTTETSLSPNPYAEKSKDLLVQWYEYNDLDL